MIITFIFPPHRARLGVKITKRFNRVAVHPSINLLNQRIPNGAYTITHLLTGCAFVVDCSSKSMALYAAGLLDELPELDYHSNVIRRSPRVKRIVREIPRL